MHKTVHKVRQYSGKSGKPSSCPDVPIDNLPAGGGSGKKSGTAHKSSIAKHSTRQSHGSKSMGGGY